MLQYLSKIITFNKLNIIGIVRNDDSEVFNLLTVTKKGNKLSIAASRSFDSIEKLIKAIDPKVPVLLSIEGKGVLHKKLNSQVEADASWLKTIDFNSIYHTTYQNDEVSFISFCRNNLVEEIVQQFKTLNLQILDIYIGSMIGSLLINSIKADEFKSGTLQLVFEENELSDFSRNDGKGAIYTIGDDQILSSHIPLYACAVHFYLKPEVISKTEAKGINLEEIIYQKAFNVFGIGMLATMFVLLFSSYMMIQYYGSQNTELNLQSLYSNQSYKQLKSLEKKREQQLLILNESGLSSETFVSHLAYDILQTIPSSIKLNELNYTPIDKEVKADKKIGFTAKTIVIKGQTNEETVFNNWLSSLKSIKWVRKFEIISLKKDKKNISQFEVNILVTNV